MTSESDSGSEVDFVEPRPSKGRPEIRPYPIEYARSAYAKWERPQPVSSEHEALKQIKSEFKRTSPDSANNVITVDLDDFEVYRSPRGAREFELAALQHFRPQSGGGPLLSLNGRISLGAQHFFIEDVEVKSYSIEGYGDDEDPKTTVYLQSKAGHRDTNCEIWYKLSRPSPTYRKIFNDFLWVAQFGKHMLDFLEASSAPVALKDFGSQFYLWAKGRFGINEDFAKWLHQYDKPDFRSVVNAYSSYVFSQASDLPESRALLSHPVWGEVMEGAFAIPKQKMLCTKTIATPTVFACFKSMYFGRCIQPVVITSTVQGQQIARMKNLKFPIGSVPIGDRTAPPLLQQHEKVFQVGDVIGVAPDDLGRWKNHGKEWLGYIQRIEPVQGTTQRLFVLWLYRSEDTTIADMIYLVYNELFMSDNCNCAEDELLSTEVLRKYSVEWQPRSFATEENFLISRRYDTAHNSFVSVKEQDFRCRCQKAKPAPLPRKAGETVLLRSPNRKTLDPVVVVRWDQHHNHATVRKLALLSSMDPDLSSRKQVAPNEVAWTDALVTVSTKRIVRECQVRFFSLDTVLLGEIPTPYDRRGNGDYFFVSTRLVQDTSGSRLERLPCAPQTLKESYDPSTATPWNALKGLSVFSGGGNLDRGVEDSGAVTFTHAVDISRSAVHTQLANAREPENFNVYWGSVDYYMQSALRGDSHHAVARIGDVQFVAAGSPCPGFSLLQSDWKSEQSLRNASHISTFCSLLDLYRPEYGVLENVVSMANVRKGFEKEKVFNQLIACCVALGYQVQYFLMDAWSYGSSQRRSRIIVSVAAPGLTPLPQPTQSHSHPDNVKQRSLGIGPEGLPYVSREFPPTPFKFVTAGEMTADLPEIGTGFRQLCLPYPDHRVSRNTGGKDRELSKRIPMGPYKQGYKAAMEQGRIPPGLRKAKKQVGRLFTRIEPNLQFPTITTNMAPNDGYCGNVLHWKEPRMISIQEARRAQGFPDHEIIVGTLDEQFRIVGNAVDRSVSLAIGLSTRKAMNENFKNGLLKAHTGALASVVYQVEDEAVEFETSSDLQPQESVSHWNTGQDAPRLNVDDPRTQASRGIEKDKEAQYTRRKSFVVQDSDDVSEDQDDSEDEIVQPNAAKVRSMPRQVQYQDENDDISIAINETSPETLAGETMPTGIKRGDDDDFTIAETENESSPDPLDDEPVSSVNTKGARANKVIDVRRFFIRHDSGSEASTDVLVKHPSLKKPSRSTTPTSVSPGSSLKRSRAESSEASSIPVKRTRQSGLQVEFTPVRWNQTVEKEAKRLALHERFR